jgi:hypothetical protein
MYSINLTLNAAEAHTLRSVLSASANLYALNAMSAATQEERANWDAKHAETFALLATFRALTRDAAETAQEPAPATEAAEVAPEQAPAPVAAPEPAQEAAEATQERGNYWNNTGRFQSLANDLEKLIPSAGPVENARQNPKLERLRKIVNAYYDLLNNGGGNRSSWCQVYARTEPVLDNAILDAALEQGLISLAHVEMLRAA